MTTEVMTEYERAIKVEWKPIKSAPRDGRWFVLWVACGMPEIALCRWTPESNCWRVKNLPGLAERLADLLDMKGVIEHRWIDLEPFSATENWKPGSLVEGER